MPRIPLGQFQQRINPNSPVDIGSTNDARLAGNAISGVGSGLMTLGQQAERVEEAGRVIELDNQRMEINQAARLSMDEALRSGEVDKAAVYNRVYEKRSKAILKDPDANPVYDRATSYAERARITTETHLQYEAMKQRSVEVLDKTRVNLNSKLDSIRENPEEAALHFRGGKAVLDEIGGISVVDAKDVTRMEAGFREEAGLALVSGYANKKQYSKAYSLLRALAKDPNMPPDLTISLKPNEAMDAGYIDAKQYGELVQSGQDYTYQLTDPKGIKLTPEESQLMLSIPSEKKSALIKQIQQKAKIENIMRMGDINSWMRGATSAALEGKPPTDAEYKAKLVQAQSIENPEQRKTLVNQLQMNKQMGIAAQEMQKAGSNADIDKYFMDAVSKIKTTGSGDKYQVKDQQNKAIEALGQVYNAVKKQRKEDPSLAFIRSDDEINKQYQMTLDGNPEASQAFGAMMSARQKHAGMSDAVILPKAASLEIGKQLMGTRNPDMLQKLVGGIEKQWGEYAPQVMREAIKTDTSLEPLTLMHVDSSPAWRRSLAENILNGKEIRESYVKMSSTAMYNSLKKSVTGGLAPINDILSSQYPGGSTAKFFNNLVDNVTIDAAKNGGNADDIVKRVKDKLRRANSNNGSVIVPGVESVVPVEQYMRKSLQPENVEKLGIAHLPNDPQQRANHIMDIVNNARWVNTPEFDGLYLKGQRGFYVDPSGNNIKVKFSDMFKEYVPASSRNKTFDETFGVVAPPSSIYEGM